MTKICSNAFEFPLMCKAAFEFPLIGFTITSPEKKYIRANDAFLNMLGYSMEELKNINWTQLTHPDDVDKDNTQYNNLINGKIDNYKNEKRYISKDGNILWIIMSTSCIRNSDNLIEYFITMIQDITTLKNIEHELRTNEIKLKEINLSKDKLFSIISHDLRSPIANLIQSLDYITSNDIDEKLKIKILKELRKSSKKTLNLLDNLLDWSLSQTGHFKLHPKNFLLNKIIYENIDLLQFSAKNKNIKLIVNAEQIYNAYADEKSINIVLRNLISNAIKFTNNDGIITISVKDIENNLEITVEDSGVGMNKETIDKIFQPNTFYSTYGTNNEKGSGLGLSLCKDFVEKNNGTIKVESELGKGSKFIFTIPKVRV